MIPNVLTALVFSPSLEIEILLAIIRWDIYYSMVVTKGRGGMGMGMANQLELISVYACCSTRAAMMFMEGGDIVPYVGHYLPNWLIIRQNYECWVLNKGRSNRQDRQAGHGRARGLKSVHDCICIIKFGTISASDVTRRTF